ncbi:hypothetical protein BHM03_00047318 [Ensete ventricosum]|nr:hypothetical protein BHM03_00047318 [Ensete ventricosum]
MMVFHISIFDCAPDDEEWHARVDRDDDDSPEASSLTSVSVHGWLRQATSPSSPRTNAPRFPMETQRTPVTGWTVRRAKLFLRWIGFSHRRRHTASTAAGNHGIPVVVSGHHFGNASGMAPRAQ